MSPSTRLSQGFHSGVHITDNGSHLVALRTNMFAPDSTTEDEIEEGRGSRRLLGLNQPVQTIVLSSSGDFVLARTHDHQIGIWEMSTGKLKYVREAPAVSPQ